MRKIITGSFMTLDGVIQAPGGPEEDPSENFQYGGWQAPFNDDGMDELMGALFADDYDLLLGRKTYDIFSSYWPLHGDNPIGEQFNKATKYVASRSSVDLSKWENTTQIEGDAIEYLRKLKQENGPNLHVWGSADLMSTLLEGDLVDQMIILTYPIILGPGKRLFDGQNRARAFNVVNTVVAKNGTIGSIYEPAGPVETGTVGV